MRGFTEAIKRREKAAMKDMVLSARMAQFDEKSFKDAYAELSNE